MFANEGQVAFALCGLVSELKINWLINLKPEIDCYIKLIGPLGEIKL